MTLPFSDKPEKSSIYQDVKTETLQELTPDQFDAFKARMFAEGVNGLEDEYRRLLLLGLASDKISTSGAIPGTLKILTFRYTTTGNNYEDLGVNEGEVWAFNTLSIAEGGSGTATVSFALYDPVSTDQSFFAVHSTGSQEPVPVSADSMGSPIYFTSDFRLNNLINATGGTHVDVDLTMIRVR